MSRFFMPNDVWECPECKQFCLVGKKCTCGKTYADVLVARSTKEKKERRKPFVPESTSGSGLLESYLKRKG